MRIEQLPEQYRMQAMQQLARTSRIGRIQGQGKPTEEPEVPSASSRKKETLTPENAGNLVRRVKVSEDGSTVSLILDVRPGAVPTAQQKGVFVDKKGHVHFFTKQKIAKAEKALIQALAPHHSHTAGWGDAPIGLQIQFRHEFPSSTSKRNLMTIAPHITRPDADNQAKLILDCLTQADFWKDDSLITSLHLYKYRSTLPPAIKITITNLSKVFSRLAELKADPIDRTVQFAQSDLFNDPFDPLTFPATQPKENT